METKEAIQKLKTDLVALKERGQEQVKILALEQYLTDLEHVATESAEWRNHQHQSSLAQYDAQATSDLEMFKSVLESGREALKAVLLINGGAAVALLGALSYVVSRDGSQELGLGISVSLADFGGGVLLAALSSGARYVTQFVYKDGHNRTGHVFNGLSILLATTAYVAFGFGMFHAYDTFNSFFAMR